MSDNNLTVVFVHGAFAESSSWNGVIQRLQMQGYKTIAAANPLRGVNGDSEFVANLLKAIEGPIVLVAHSYGGTVITNAARDNANVKALIYVGAFAPLEGETASELSDRFPGSTLGETLWTVPLGDGSNDLYIQPDKYPQQFAADVPLEQTVLMAAGQRPLRDAGLSDPSGKPAWKSIPSWFIFGEADKNIPVAVHRFMAERAGARETVEVKGASHVVGISNPDAVTGIIVRAIQSEVMTKTAVMNGAV